jgi:Fe-S cluster assembly iron-binding protein IscA
MFIRCPYCHRRVLRWFYSAHEKKHIERRADGQQADHVTAPPTARFAGSLDDVPQVYVHTECGTATRMPEDIIRTYLACPMGYSDASFCCGCGEYVPSAELTWDETGESVLAYAGRLRLQFLRTELGMTLPERPTALVVSPRAVRKLREVLKEVDMPAAFVALSLAGNRGGAFKLDISPSLDAETEVVVSTAGLQFAVSREITPHIAGVVIDYTDTPVAGFAIVRLFPPDVE